MSLLSHHCVTTKMFFHVRNSEMLISGFTLSWFVNNKTSLSNYGSQIEYSDQY